MIPGEDLNVQFKAKKAFPTIFKLVAQLESQRDEVEHYEINQIIKVVLKIETFIQSLVKNRANPNAVANFY